MILKETYASRRLHDAWESVYRGNPTVDRLNDRMMDRILACVAAPPNALFLDAGCGIGDHAVRIALRGYRCLGVDISAAVLREAKKSIADQGLQSRISLVCQPLEELSLGDGTVDVVHCRGVLMHIPEWERALHHLCRVLRPGGKIVLLELNHRSLETRIVRLARRFRSSKSQIRNTDAGLEFWSEEQGLPFVVRNANTRYLADRLRSQGFGSMTPFATEFWDINRFPAGIIRSAVLRFNELWFRLRLPAAPSGGIAIIGTKAG